MSVSTVVMTRERWPDLAASLPHHAGPVIVVDNGSRDDSVERVRRAFPEVALIALPHNRGAAARNVGVAAARTPYVAFADDDSWWAPGALERASLLLDADPRLAVVAARVLVGAEERLDPTCAAMASSPLPATPAGPRVLGFIACGAVVRRAAFEAVGGFDRVLGWPGEEELLALRLAAAGFHCAYAADVVAHHHPSPRRPPTLRRRALEERNEVLTAVLVRPWRVVVHTALRRLGGDAGARLGLAWALARLPRALRARSPLPAEVERQRRLLDRMLDSGSSPFRSPPLGYGLYLTPRPPEGSIVTENNVPGVPGPQPPTLEEPTSPREPLPPKPDQTGPEVRTSTGALANEDQAVNAQQGEFLTTSVGARLRDTDHSLKAGPRGPTLLQDHHLREKITHFDHERIPERVVHARGVAAHGVFTGYGTASEVTCAAFLGKDVETPVFTRFSTVLGSRGSADSVRDTRGFATKFYTDEGIFDLVGNNIPVFFIQDGIKFPDIVHAAKPHPDREIPQAQSAHDTFWDFVSLHTEAQAHTLWNMSDRGIPRSLRMMEGFGVHTFRLINAEGGTSLAKFHWKPKLGAHALTWEEAQLAAGFDPDLHRRDLADAIESGAFPEWELGVQVFPDTPEETFHGIDLLDPTKFVPEELAPVQPIGKMVLNRNPSNYFAETEQVAFHPGNLVRGVDVTNDALLQARLFSYIDTQLTRLGGPNFNQIPINRPHAPVNDMLRDGFHQDGVHRGVAPYKPNSLDGGCPFHAGATDDAFVEAAVQVAAAPKTRAQAASFDDHFSQARLFWLSMTPVEQEHIANAYAFELGKCYEQVIKERQLQCLANIDTALCEQVAGKLGLPAPDATVPLADPEPSAALSMVGRSWPTDGRLVGVVVCPDSPVEEIASLRTAIFEAGMVPLLIGPTGGTLSDGTPLQRSFDTARSIEFDAVLLAPGLGTLAEDPRVSLLLTEVYRQAKAIGSWGDGEAALTAARLAPSAAGIVTGQNGTQVLTEVAGLLSKHRAWERLAG